MNAPFFNVEHNGPAALTFTLLRLLADGEFHSGETLARQLGISRASVSNALAHAVSVGLELYSVRGRGYCLAKPFQWLDGVAIAKHLGTAAGHFQIEILDSAESSNSLLMKRVEQGAKTGSVLAVEWQNRGRGRMGRRWHSGLGSALTFSLLWRFECGLSKLPGLSLAIGVALIRAFHALGITDVSLKWPNDLLGPAGKLGGILVETQGDMLGPSVVVIGIGLNLISQEAALQHIDQPVSCLADVAPEMPERNRLLATILYELHLALSNFAQSGFAPLRLEWESHHSAQGQKVHLLHPNGTNIWGVARGVADDGSLILETAQGTRLFNAGEVSLRMQQNQNASD